MTVDTTTGEIVPRAVTTLFDPMTPEQAGTAAAWVREMQRAVLVDGTDYAQYGEAKKPTLLKSGAEMLCLASGASAEVELLTNSPMLVRYKCAVTMPNGRKAECEGTADYDEWNFCHGNYRAPRNTLVKMAQKRAYVGAVLLAHAASGLFVADVGDDGEDRRVSDAAATSPAQSATAPPADGVPATTDAAVEAPPCDTDAAEGDKATMARVAALGPDARKAMDARISEMRWPWPPTSPAVIKAANRWLDELEADR